MFLAGFKIELNTRRVYLAGCTRQPTSEWVTQQACQFVWDRQSAPSPPRFLSHDRARQFSASFDTVLMSEGITIIRTPPQTPNANAYAEAGAHRS